tara:strand:+ start:552 stop:1340 length:789 start_codon:yes stop_codon:yes gene_type:complete
MPVSPPLDKIPAVPAQAVTAIMELVSNQINNLQEQAIDAIERSSLPDQVDCDDPRVQAAIEAFDNLNDLINRIRDLIPTIQRVTNTIQTVIGTAQAVKAAQLLNPVTGPAVIAAELVIVQNMTIANALIAIQQFKNIPTLIENAILGLGPTLLDVSRRLATVCDENGIEFNIDNLNLNALGEIDVDGDGIGDLGIDQLDGLLKQQQDLLQSLEEAPSKVYSDNGAPSSDLGKPGDYYIDLQNKLIYGPKPTRTTWGDGINFE